MKGEELSKKRKARSCKSKAGAACTDRDARSQIAPIARVSAI